MFRERNGGYGGGGRAHFRCQCYGELLEGDMLFKKGLQHCLHPRVSELGHDLFVRAAVNFHRTPSGMQIPFEYAELSYADRYAIRLHPRYAGFYQRVLFPPTVRPECHGNPSISRQSSSLSLFISLSNILLIYGYQKRFQVSQCLPFVQHAQGCKGECKYSPHQANTPT